MERAKRESARLKKKIEEAERASDPGTNRRKDRLRNVKQIVVEVFYLT
jgi:hypothetical protein